MRIHRLFIVLVCVGLLAFLGLACCCPTAFPVGPWSESVGSNSTSVAVPKLDITYPVQGDVTDSSQMEVSGLTDSDASLSVNGKSLTVYSDGSFKGVVELQPGENSLIFTAIRPGGDPAIREITVTSNCST
ncbi:MAG: hypothetical protein WC891_04210 [Actinomycetota bacterium]